MTFSCSSAVEQLDTLPDLCFCECLEKNWILCHCPIFLVSRERCVIFHVNVFVANVWDIVVCHVWSKWIVASLLLLLLLLLLYVWVTTRVLQILNTRCQKLTTKRRLMNMLSNRQSASLHSASIIVSIICLVCAAKCANKVVLEDNWHQFFNLPSIRSTIPVHYVGTSFGTERCFVLNELTKIYIHSCGDAGKNQS